MAVQAVSNSAVLRLRWSGTTRAWNNILGLIYTTGGTPTFDQATVDAIYTAIRGASSTTALMALMAGTTVLEGIGLRNFSIPNQTEFLSSGAPLAGAGVGDQLPLSNAACVTLRTALSGKSFRGRVYISGWTEAENDANGRILASANTAAAAFISGIGGVLAPHFLGLAVLSRPRDAVTIPVKTRPANAGHVTILTLAEARNTKWESQRRRTGRE
jgi:hypothetical protein